MYRLDLVSFQEQGGLLGMDIRRHKSFSSLPNLFHLTRSNMATFLVDKCDFSIVSIDQESTTFKNSNILSSFPVDVTNRSIN